MKKIYTPDIIILFIILQILLNFIFPVKIINYPWTYFGILLIILGQIPNFWIYFYFRKKKTTTHIDRIPDKLITSGLFKITRNPNYLGMVITLLGVAVLLGSLTAFIFPVVFIILTHFFVIPIEERNLENRFGKRYLNYKNKVRRWI